MVSSSQLQRMYSQLDSLGIGKLTYAPPAYRLAWRLGINVTPPLFANFITNALFMGLFFGVFLSLCSWLLSPLHLPGFVPSTLTSVAFAAIFFGLFMATVFRSIAKQHNLPTWSVFVSRDST